ncbi:peroxidase family protein [Lyngbya confervoides]|uniref:Heme peroxidase n=1 Tax=Lyngbya confervoides BDU141951 TaxID=1574623 RepID=A0ABD4T106_9CYAN|nr:peroxidase family protein [Lyngbya confervoides]MCM1982163.1 heme peroxidase [Lyngbya confervoides BDU141951]
MARNTAKDGFKNQLQTFLLTHFAGVWKLIERSSFLSRRINKFLINNAIYAIPTRPYPYSLMTLEPVIPGTSRPKKTDTYTSWDSLIDRTYTGRHLPPDFAFNQADRLPDLSALRVLFDQPQDAAGIPQGREAEKSTLLFPYWVQWFTDGFLRTDRHNRLKNTSNHHIDLSPVYGLTPSMTHRLRSFSGGKLKSQLIDGAEFPPFLYEDPEQGRMKSEFEGLYEPLRAERELDPQLKSKLFAMGVERANVQIGYVMFNVLCLREHNRLCDQLAQRYADWDDERLFQTARNILIVEIMKVVIEEYINHITPYHFNFRSDPLSFTHEKWYRTNWMTLEFSLVYRWHSALPQRFLYRGEACSMSRSLWNNQMLMDVGIAALFEESSRQPAARIGLFNTPHFLVDSTELASIDLGRQAKLASYNDYRALCQFPRVTDFDQITADPQAQQLLKSLYQHVDNLEFYVGLYAEDVRPNSALPPLMGRLVGIDAFSQALTNPLLAENIFNPDTFSPLGWEVIHETRSLSDIVNRNIPESPRPFHVSFYR